MDSRNKELISGNMKFLIVVFLLIIVAVFNLKFFYFKQEAASEKTLENIPLVIGQWTGTNISMTERIYEILETKDVLFREYKKEPIGSDQDVLVYLCIVYSKDNRKVSHPPEVCYEGDGLSVINKSIEPLSFSNGVFNANKLILQKNKSKQLVIYWYKVGDKFTTNYYKQQLQSVLNRIRRKSKSGCALIRFSGPIINDDEETAVFLMKKFIEEVLPFLK